MLKIVEINKVYVGENPRTIVFSDNGSRIAVAAGNHAKIINEDGKLIKYIHGDYEINCSSYCCNKFGFVGFYRFYITDEDGNLIKKFKTSDYYDSKITLIHDGFMACNEKCGFFNYSGNMLWDYNIDIRLNPPFYHNGMWFIAGRINPFIKGPHDVVMILDESGGEINRIPYYGEYALDVKVCKDLMAVSTSKKVYLYDIVNPTDPKLLWTSSEKSPIQLSFSPDCKYLATAVSRRCKIKIYNTNSGDVVLEKRFGNCEEYERRPVAVTWWDNRLAVGTYEGYLYMYLILTSSIF